MKIPAGIDPGKQGFIVILSDPIEKIPIPLWDGDIDLPELSHLIAEWLPGTMVALEDIFSFAGTGKSTMFVMGRVLGNIEMALACNGISYEMVKPKVWQKEVWGWQDIVKKPSKSGKTMVNDTKATSINCAQRLYPDFDLTKSLRAYTPNDNVADALLLAEYSKRKLINR